MVGDQSRIEPKTTKQKKNKGTHKEIQIRELSQRGQNKIQTFEFRYNFHIIDTRIITRISENYYCSRSIKYTTKG